MRAWWLLAGWVSACSPPVEATRDPATPVTRVDAPAAGPAVALPPPPSPDVPEGPIGQMLERVAKVRGLPVKRPVPGRKVTRQEAIEHIMAKTEKEVPEEVLRAQGEMLRALELIPLDYAFVDGMYALLQNNIAGFYDQHEDAMFLLDDLDAAGDDETLAHELVHALQDQNFDLEPLLQYTPGEADRTSAGHAVVEGDATAAMIEVEYGVGMDLRVPVDEMRVRMEAGVARTEGNRTPRVLQLSLVAPYTDGFAFVEALKRSGGWPAIDAVYARLPRSTEQLLHVEKYLADEMPIPVPEPPIPQGFRRVDADVLGEQSLRILFATWVGDRVAAEAAAGWGGDRFVIVRRDGDGAWATLLDLRFDSVDDADEAARALQPFVSTTTCRPRKDLGPVAVRRQGDRIVLVAGPFARTRAKVQAAGDCQWARRWIDGAFLQAP